MKYGPNLTARHLAGSLDKLVKQAARDTLVANMDADREGNPRWARIPDAEACDFCEMLGSRGFVYHSEKSAGADNPWHPHCNCQIAVSFDPAIDMYWKGGTHVSRGYGMEDAELVMPGRDGSYELRDVDIDGLFERYLESGRAYSSPKSRVFKRFAEGSFMNDPIKHLMESATVDELESRAAEVLAEYRRVYSEDQLRKYLPSARSAAQRRMRELKSTEVSQLRINQRVAVSRYNVPTGSGTADGYGFDVPLREYQRKRDIDDGRISMGANADPDEWEIATARILDGLGFNVKFRARSLKRNDRRADVAIDGKHWEIKNPAGSGYLCVHNQIKSNLYGQNKHFLNPQSELVIISNVRSGLSMEEMEEQLVRVMTGESGFIDEELSCIKRVMLVDKSGMARVFDYRNR